MSQFFNSLDHRPRSWSLLIFVVNKFRNLKNYIMSTTKWNIDPTHSEITFKVKHLMISTVTGNFKVFEGVAETETEEFKNISNIDFKADVSSINTNNEQRDEHLRSADFFASEENPYIEFKAQNFNTDNGKLEGDLI